MVYRSRYGKYPRKGRSPRPSTGGASGSKRGGDAKKDGPPIISVSELTQHIKYLLMKDPKLTNVWVVGELSNFKHHASGHMYFSLKDAKAQLRCVFFRSYNRDCAFEPEDGQKVIARGYVDVYEVRGEYQLYVLELLPHGVGELYLAFLQLKKRLEKEGLFDASRKRSLPRYPERIGVVTSPTGAALRDILRVLTRRYPAAEVLLFPTLVQGEAAPRAIVRALRLAHSAAVARADVLIVGRGGGSIEDLWAFNTESVARAISKATIPIIAAVGHETDFTIADFVADQRAPTPSAGAELAVPDRRELTAQLRDRVQRLQSLLENMTRGPHLVLRQLSRSRVFTRPFEMVHRRAERLDELLNRLVQAWERYDRELAAQLDNLEVSLLSMDPYAILQRGYAIVTRAAEDERHAVAAHTRPIVRSIADVELGERLAVRVYDGTLDTAVTAKTDEPIPRARLEDDNDRTGARSGAGDDQPETRIAPRARHRSNRRS